MQREKSCQAWKERSTNSCQVFSDINALACTGFWVYDLVAQCTHWSAGMYALTGAARDEPRRDLLTHIHPDDADRVSTALRFSTPKQGCVTLECRLKGFEAEQRRVIINACVAQKRAGRPERIVGSMCLAPATVGSREALAQDVLSAHEDERKRIAQDLHDHLGAEAASALFRATRLRDAGVHQVTVSELDTLIRELQSVVEGIRTAAHDLHPIGLDRLGLKAATRQYAARLGSVAGVAIRVQFDPAFDKIQCDAAIERLLYRLIQECLTNVLKHSKATKADVFFGCVGDRMRVFVEDNGIGIDPENKNPGLGLESMRERFSLVGGDLEVGPSLSGGTCVTVTIPVRGDFGHWGKR